MAAVEGPVGTWRLVDSLEKEYGRIRLVRLDGEPRYRTEFRGRLLGYGATLRSSCERGQQAYIASVAPGGRIGWEAEGSATRRNVTPGR
ncbi:hypothetical protein [Agromyces sp. NPDC058104]|uniref:hypothetical protein n=1 Tax=Agromyces sp. NPDC058104 TaxID=3346342 RepID=UPI0036D8E8F4